MADTIYMRELVRFQPPEVAYSTESLQHQHIGKVGLVQGFWNDGYAYVLFDKQLVLCNSTYLSEVERPVRHNSWG